MNKSFDGKVVIITGAGAGIGEAAALAFAERGAKIVVNSRTQESTYHTIDEIRRVGGTAVAACGDVSKEETVKHIIQTAISTFKRIDVLVNNAGVVMPGTIDTLSVHDLDMSFDTNVRSIFILSRAVLPAMRENGSGSIINIASIAALKGTRNRLAYSASKGAVVSMTRSMALDLASDNIRVNCICPGMTYSPSLAKRIADTPDPKQTEENFIAAIPIGRFGQPWEIASAIIFAASEENSFMTGGVITVDGGKSL